MTFVAGTRTEKDRAVLADKACMRGVCTAIQHRESLIVLAKAESIASQLVRQPLDHGRLLAEGRVAGKGRGGSGGHVGGIAAGKRGRVGRQGREAKAGEGGRVGENLQADAWRGSGGDSMQFLQSLLPLRADMLQDAPLRLPLEVVVHHLVQRLVVIPVIHPALEASQLTPVS